MASVQASAALGAPGGLSAAAVAGPDLWAAYQAAESRAQLLWTNLGIVYGAGGTSGATGDMYNQAYAAQQASDQAYQAYLEWKAQIFPGARG